MVCDYRLCVDKFVSDEQGAVDVFGIEGCDSRGRVCVCVRQVFTERDTALAAVQLFNRHRLDPIHLTEVLEDLLG